MKKFDHEIWKLSLVFGRENVNSSKSLEELLENSKTVWTVVENEESKVLLHGKMTPFLKCRFVGKTKEFSSKEAFDILGLEKMIESKELGLTEI